LANISVNVIVRLVAALAGLDGDGADARSIMAAWTQKG
jgi:hypothetical protein